MQLTKDYDGTIPADLSGIDKVVLIARPSMISDEHQFQIDCAFTPEGVVTTTFTPEIVNYRNGLWYAEYHCLDAEGNLRQNYRAYLCIRKGMTGSKNGPHTITAMDVRLALMDTSA